MATLRLSSLHQLCFFDDCSRDVLDAHDFGALNTFQVDEGAGLTEHDCVCASLAVHFQVLTLNGKKVVVFFFALYCMAVFSLPSK